MTTQAFVNVVIPFPARQSDDVHAEIRKLTAPVGNAPRAGITKALLDTGVVHFMSISVIDPECPHERKLEKLRPRPSPETKAHLVFEMSVDGGRTPAIKVLATTLHAEVRAILSAAGVVPDRDLYAYLMRRTHTIGARWIIPRLLRQRPALGQVHGGSPGLSVTRIRKEKTLASQIASDIRGWQVTVNPRWRSGSARQRLDMVRNTLWERAGFKWAFVPEAAPLLAPSPDRQWQGKPLYLNPMYWKAGFSIFNTLLWPLYLLALPVAWLVYETITHAHWPLILDIFIVGAFLFALLIFWKLRKLEKADPEDNQTPRADHVNALLDVENHCAQNLLASSSRLKGGWLRRLTLRFAFAMVGTGRFVGRPGFLGKNGVIHFARWMRLPGTDQLLFFSNYSGTWDSYVGDFIADAPTGVTAIWSNCTGFPRTSGLLGGGAQNRDRLVRWARRQQQPVNFWFSAYHSLTAERIRINAAIRQGLATAETEADAVDWLSLFGSAPRPGTTLQVNEIPRLVFGGLSSLRFSACYTLSFRGGVKTCKQWVALAGPMASYGEMKPGDQTAVVVAFTASGLRRLGVPDKAVETFPVALQHGMTTDARARQLGDTGENARDRWHWGKPEEEIHVLLVVYGETDQHLTAAVQVLRNGAQQCGHHFRDILQLATLAPKKGPGIGIRTKEPFGFEDGVSQPVIKGSPRWSLHANPSDLVEAGEIVLGYPDNLGKIPPSPSIDAGCDPLHYLPDLGPDPFRQRPEFSSFEGTGQRDLGANGTFLVVRQLEQHVKRLDDWVQGSVRKQLENAGHAGFLRFDTVDTDEQGHQHFIRVTLTGAQPLAVPRARRREPIYDKAADDKAAAVPVQPPPPAAVPVQPPAAGVPVQPQQPPHADALKEFIGAKLIGRWRDGTSTVRYREQAGSTHVPPALPDNDFMLGAEDPSALSCPFGAHIRRANPRDTRFPGSAEELATVNRHRMLRVGRVYGEPDPAHQGELDRSKPQGLLFMCLNADIERQFEFVQRTWLLNPNLHGLENEVDPLLGPGPKRFTIPMPTGPLQLRHMPTLVTVAGGGYFFLPGRAVLRFLGRDLTATSVGRRSRAAATGAGTTTVAAVVSPAPVEPPLP